MERSVRSSVSSIWIICWIKGSSSVMTISSLHCKLLKFSFSFSSQKFIPFPFSFSLLLTNCRRIYCSHCWRWNTWQTWGRLKEKYNKLFRMQSISEILSSAITIYSIVCSIYLLRMRTGCSPVPSTAMIIGWWYWWGSRHNSVVATRSRRCCGRGSIGGSPIC